MALEKREQVDKVIHALKEFSDAQARLHNANVFVQDKLVAVKNAIGTSSANGVAVVEEAKQMVGEYFIKNPPMSV